MQIWRPMCEDGLAQEDDAVWRRGGVDGRPGKVDASVPALKMDRWKMVATTSTGGVCGARLKCAGPLYVLDLALRLCWASGFRC